MWWAGSLEFRSSILVFLFICCEHTDLAIALFVCLFVFVVCLSFALFETPKPDCRTERGVLAENGADSYSAKRPETGIVIPTLQRHACCVV